MAPRPQVRLAAALSVIGAKDATLEAQVAAADIKAAIKRIKPPSSAAGKGGKGGRDAGGGEGGGGGDGGSGSV